MIIVAKKGHVPWNKGRKGLQVAWNKGNVDMCSKEVIKKMSESHLGQSTWNKGKHLSKEHKRNLSNSHKGLFSGENHPNWQGGKTFELYGLEFNDELRESIRERDNHTCQECGMAEKELGYTLSCHHIDYCKTNNSEDNLISLCRSCHSQTNFGRDDWINYFNEKRSD